MVAALCVVVLCAAAQMGVEFWFQRGSGARGRESRDTTLPEHALRVVLAGAFENVGQSVLRAMVAQGYDVVCLDHVVQVVSVRQVWLAFVCRKESRSQTLFWSGCLIFIIVILGHGGSRTLSVAGAEKRAPAFHLVALVGVARCTYTQCRGARIRPYPSLRLMSSLLCLPAAVGFDALTSSGPVLRLLRLLRRAVGAGPDLGTEGLSRARPRRTPTVSTSATTWAPTTRAGVASPRTRGPLGTAAVDRCRSHRAATRRQNRERWASAPSGRARRARRTRYASRARPRRLRRGPRRSGVED